MKPFIVVGVDRGFCHVNYKTKNSLGQTIYYCVQEDMSHEFHIYRCCKNFEPQSLVHLKVPVSMLFEIPWGMTPLEIRVRQFIQEN